MIRVLHMIDEAIVGGGQTHVLELARHLNKARFETSVACGEEGFLVDELRREAIPVFSLPMSNRPRYGEIAACVNLMKSLRPHIVHTHGGTPGFVARMSSFFAPPTKFVHSYHGMHYLHNLHILRNRLYRFADRFLKRATDAFICVAQSDYDLGLKHNIIDAPRARIIRYGIDVNRFSGTPRPRSGSATVIGTVGRLHTQKGQRYLISAASTVVKSDPDVVFRIVGEGELRGELVAQVSELGLDGKVEFLGARTDIPTFFEEIDIFVLPSLWEGLPIVLLEAMAAGKPIIVSAVDGVKEAVSDGVNGLLVPAKDPEKLAAALLKVVRDPALAQRLATKAVERVRAEFSTMVMVGKIEDLYMKLAGESTS